MYRDEDDNGMSVFLRDEPEKPEAAASAPAPGQSQGSSVTVILVAVLAIVVAVGAAGAWYVFRPQVDLSLRTPPTESHPYRASVEYVRSFDEMRAIAGDELQVADAGNTVVDWNISGSGYAEIHLDVVGPKGAAEVWIDWSREQDAWLVKSASYRIGEGQRRAIPLGRGEFLSQEDLDVWRQADPTTLLGRGQRELVAGQYLQAVELFTRALSDEATGEDAAADMEPLYWRGRAFEALNNTPKAIADYQRLLTFAPQHQKALARLDAMRASPPPDQPRIETPDIEERAKVTPVAPVSLIPR